MVRKPEEIGNGPSPEQLQKQAKDLEEWIDGILGQSKRQDPVHPVPVPTPFGEQVIAVVRERYIQAGWRSVEVERVKGGARLLLFRR